MKHVILRNRRNLIIYTIIWFILISVHFSALYWMYHIDFWPAFTECMLMDLVFGLFGLSLWYPVKYSMFLKANSFAFFVHHFSSFFIIMLLWHGGTDHVQRLLHKDNTLYLKFLDHALPWHIVTGFLYYTITILTYYVIIYYESLQEKIKVESILREKVKEAELNLLKSQINPHFLFNSLNSISSLTMFEPEQAQEMIIKLSEYLRYCVSPHREGKTSLSSELENLVKYLDIEKIRFGNKLNFVQNVKIKNINILVPAMILQPLVENCIKHGVYESLDVITIETKITEDDVFTYIAIKNNFDAEQKNMVGAGIGLANIKDRLAIFYRTDGLLEVKKNDGVFEVIVKIPKIFE